MMRFTNSAMISGSSCSPSPPMYYYYSKRKYDEIEIEEVKIAKITHKDERTPLLMPEENENQNEEETDDVISKSIGEYGRWQLRLTFLLSLFNIPCTFHIFGPTFQAAERKMWCSQPVILSSLSPTLWANASEFLGSCPYINTSSSDNSSYQFYPSITKYSGHTLITCDKWEFDGEGSTIISDFNLICDRSYLVNVAEMTFLVGVAFGGLVGGIISDKYGRKRTLICCVLLQAIIGTAIAFAPWFEMYVVLRALLGFVSVSVVFSGFVLTVELVGGTWRTIAGVCYIFPVSLSYMLIAGIAWFLRDWRQLQLAISLPGFIFACLWWVLPESPLWLLAMGRTKELLHVLLSASLENKKPLPDNIDKQLLPTSHQQESGSVLDLFKTAKMRKTTFVLSVIWFVLYIVYYGLVLNIGNIGGNLYINSVLSGVVELPAVALSIIFLLRLGRRWPLSLTLFFAGVACLITVPLPYIMKNYQWLITSLAMVGKFSISSTNVIVPIFTAELYPTTIRNIGVGASNVTAGIALILVPYLWELANINQSVPMLVLGLSGLVGGIAVWLLQETGNKPLAAGLEGDGIKTVTESKDATKCCNEAA